MTTRAEILAETIARLEAERYAPLLPVPSAEPLGWTPEEQAAHRMVLLDALSDDAVVVAWRERRAS